MPRALIIITAILAGFLLGMFGRASVPAQAMVEPTPTKIPSTFTPRPTNTHWPTRTPTVQPSPTITPTPVQAIAAGGVPFGWPGQVQCWNCSPFSVRVKLSHYNPQEFNPDFPQLNCWLFSVEQEHCLSPVWIGVPWESVWGFGAACPVDWPVGTWVEIPEVGSFICLDHGHEITCKDGLCRVDLLGPGGADWDGKEFDVNIWVPTSYLLRLQERQ